MEFYKKRNHKKALNSFVKATKKNPNHADAQYYKACALSDLKREYEALRAFDIAIELNPNNANYYASKGISLYHLNKFESAVQTLYEALKIEPNKYWNILAQIYIHNKNFEEASKCIDKALINEPDNIMFKKLKLLINSGFKYGNNFHIPIERSLLLYKIPQDEEIIYSTRLKVKITDQKMLTDAIFTKNGIAAAFPFSGLLYVGWNAKNFNRGNKFRINNCSCSLLWESRYETNTEFNERKKAFREVIIKLKNI